MVEASNGHYEQSSIADLSKKQISRLKGSLFHFGKNLAYTCATRPEPQSQLHSTQCKGYLKCHFCQPFLDTARKFCWLLPFLIIYFTIPDYIFHHS